jgi:hypothetical protein
MLRWIKACLFTARVLVLSIVDGIATYFALNRQLDAVERVVPTKLTGEAVGRVLEDLFDQLKREVSASVLEAILGILCEISAGNLPEPAYGADGPPFALLSEPASDSGAPSFPLDVMPTIFPVSAQRRRRMAARLA